MFSHQCRVIILSLFMFTIFTSFAVNAETNQQLIQQKFNEQILTQPFNSESDAVLSQSLKEATERGIPSKSKTQNQYYQYWHNGYYYPYAAYRLGYWY